MQRQELPTQLAFAERLFAYLALAPPVIRATDAIWGFGHFDLNIPRRCGELYVQGYAPRIIFSGGIGSGTADLGQPEARAFRAELRRCYPQIPPEALVLEDSSTNTGENVRYTQRLLQQTAPELAFGRGIQSLMLVASAYRQRRVWLTCRQHLPALTFVNAPPNTTFAQELRRFADKGFELPRLLVGEIERLQRYGEAGYLVAEPVPENIHQCCTQLRNLLTID